MKTFTCRCEKEDKKAEGFQIWNFYWSFSSAIMAVKAPFYPVKATDPSQSPAALTDVM